MESDLINLNTWTEFKSFVDSRSLSVQWFDSDGNYYLAAFDGVFTVFHTMIKDSGDDQTEFESNYKSVGNKPVLKIDPDGKPIQAIGKPSGQDFKAIVSHDFSNQTSWYTESTRVSGETLSGSGTGPYTSAHDNWIDLTSGLVPREDEILSTYAAKIYDNGSEVTSGITVDYAAGTVTFDSAPTGPVTADYSYEDGSTWTLAPESGKVMSLEHAELDFTLDVSFNIVYFEIWAYNPADLPNKMMVEQVIYKGMKDILKIANDVQVVPAIGEITEQTLRAVFDYASTIDLKDSLGMELRIRTKDDAVMTGEFGSITLYTVSKDE